MDGGFATDRLVIEWVLEFLGWRRTYRVSTQTNVKNLTKKILLDHIVANPVLGSAFGGDDEGSCGVRFGVIGLRTNDLGTILKRSVTNPVTWRPTP